MKTCTLCHRDKLKTDFNRNATKRDGLQSKCRECSQRCAKDHYIENRGYYQARNQDARRKMLEEVQKLKTRPCADCGQTFPPYVMDFDHLDGADKVGSVAAMIQRRSSLQQILQEVLKCELVCANCHRIRTHNRTNGAHRKSNKRFP